MLNPFFSESSFLWRCVWQTTVCLAVGGLFSFLWMRRPVRAHRVLVLAMIASLATPLLSQLVHESGWGILRAPSPGIGFESTEVSPALPLAPVVPESNSSASLSVNEETSSAVRRSGVGEGVRRCCCRARTTRITSRTNGGAFCVMSWPI